MVKALTPQGLQSRRLLLEYQATRDRRLRDKIFEQNKELIWKVVHRFREKNIELDDLFQVGAFGLMKAIKRYEPSTGNALSSLAIPLIYGEIQHYIRDHGRGDQGKLRIPGQFQEIYARVTATVRKWNAVNSPDRHITNEIAAEQLSVRNWAEIEAACNAPRLTRLDSILSDSDRDEPLQIAWEPVSDPHSPVREALAALPEWKRLLLKEHYENGTPLAVLRTKPWLIEALAGLTVSEGTLGGILRAIKNELEKLLDEHDRDIL